MRKDDLNKVFLLGKTLFPICRSITGPGFNSSLRLLKNFNKSLKIKKIKSGTKVFDWKVPPEWSVKKAYVLDKKNKKIIDFKKNNLHLVNFSKPFQGFLKKGDLLKKIYRNM